jgi:hypothetical protein
MKAKVNFPYLPSHSISLLFPSTIAALHLLYFKAQFAFFHSKTAKVMVTVSLAQDYLPLLTATTAILISSF